MAKVSVLSPPAVSTVYITPFIRQGVLVEISPTPNPEEADFLINILAQDWARLHELTKKEVASVVNVHVGDMKFNESEIPHKHFEGNTRVLDLPCLQVMSKHLAFANRQCVAICTGEMSTKTWSRVGMPLDDSGARDMVPVEHLEKLTSAFRKVTFRLSTWMFEQLQQVITTHFPDSRVKKRGRLEVASFGVRDKNLASYFEKLLDTHITAAEILEDQEANQRLSQYFKAASDVRIQGNLRELIEEHPEDYLWFSSPASVEAEDGYVEPREVLFLMRALDKKAQALGIGYDDSAKGDLSHVSVNRVAKWIGQKV